MIGVVAAGGMGTRLLPLTRFINKQLCPVRNGKLMIDYPLEHLRSFGVSDVHIVTSGGGHLSQLTEYTGDGSRYGFSSLEYAIQPNPLGIADCLRRVAHVIRNAHEGVLLALGDNYFSEHQVFDGVGSANSAMAWQFDVVDAQKAKSFGQAIFDESERVVGLVEKPEFPQHSKIITGLYYFPSDVVDVVETLKPSKRGEFEITDLLSAYCNEGRLQIADVRGDWSDLGEWSSWQRHMRGERI